MEGRAGSGRQRLDDLVSALDRDWLGPLPHTVLVALGREILWHYSGLIDHAEARAAIGAAFKPYYALPNGVAGKTE